MRLKDLLDSADRLNRVDNTTIRNIEALRQVDLRIQQIENFNRRSAISPLNDELIRQAQRAQELFSSRSIANDFARQAYETGRILASSYSIGGNIRQVHEAQRLYEAFGGLSITDRVVLKERERLLGTIENASFRHIQEAAEKVYRPFLGESYLNKSTVEAFGALKKQISSPIPDYGSEVAKKLALIEKATTLSFSSSISRMFEERSISSIDKMFLSQMPRFLDDYSNFTSSTLEKINKARQADSFALQNSLILANEQVIRSAGLVQNLLDTERSLKVGIEDPFYQNINPRYNRFRIQQEELLEDPGTEEESNYENLLIISHTAKRFEIIHNCISLLWSINENSETNSGEPIFKLTNMLGASSWHLLGVVATSKENLSLLIHDWYMILYEGAGTDHLRYIERGYLTKEEAEVIWILKDLRNKWLKHDSAHGSEGKIKTSRLKRIEAIRALGLEKMPTSKADFMHLEEGLLSKIEAFMILLNERTADFREQ